MPLIPSPLFQIRLENDTLTMRGSQTESVGCVLRGQLVLAITEPTKFKEINLTFQGISKIGWVEGLGKDQSEERILYQHDWTFLPEKKQYHILKPDNYHWDFELVLPGTLPETIEGCQNGNIKYVLKAVAERPTFALNLHTRRKVTFVRSLLPSSLEFLQTSVVASTWTDRVEYEFSVDSKVFCLGDKIPITINLKSLDENLKVQNILCIFKECVCYTAGKNKMTDSRIISDLNHNDFPKDTDSWNHLMEISIPDNLERSTRCLYDSNNDTIQISHKLKFYVTLTDGVNHRECELRANLPIIIASISPENDTDLPAYNVYDEFYPEKRDSRSPSLSSSTSSSTRSSFDEPLYEIQDMNELPSYRTISSSIPIPLADSLLPPTYDSSINGH